jgi:hypothetical protein
MPLEKVIAVYSENCMKPIYAFSEQFSDTAYIANTVFEMLPVLKQPTQQTCKKYVYIY